MRGSFQSGALMAEDPSARKITKVNDVYGERGIRGRSHRNRRKRATRPPTAEAHNRCECSIRHAPHFVHAGRTFCACVAERLSAFDCVRKKNAQKQFPPTVCEFLRLKKKRVCECVRFALECIRTEHTHANSQISAPS